MYLIKQTQETWLKANYVGVDPKSGLGLPDRDYYFLEEIEKVLESPTVEADFRFTIGWCGGGGGLCNSCV